MNILEYRADARNGQDWTEAFRRAAECARDEHGGVIDVPPGRYPLYALRLYDHTTLNVQAGATLFFLDDPQGHPVIDCEFEGLAGKAYMPCIYARDAQHVTLSGQGTLDGNGAMWWHRHVRSENEYARPYLVCMENCREVLIENLLLINSPVWTVHPLYCENVTVRNVRIVNPPTSPNTDGINPDSCRNVHITGCTIDVGDDCIAVKAGTEDTVRRVPCEDILIENCHMLHGHGGVVLGSEMSGGVRNVMVRDCVFEDTDRGVRLKTRRMRGGSVSGLQVSRVTMRRVVTPFVVNMFYFCGKDGKLRRVWDKSMYPVDDSTPRIEHVTISDVTALGAGACAGYFYGLPESPITGLTLRNVRVEMDASAEPSVPAMMDGCPAMRGHGVFARHVDGLTLQDVTIGGITGATLDRDESVRLHSADTAGAE